MNEKKYLKLSDLEVYKVAFSLSNEVWDMIIIWDNFPKQTIENQFVRAMDSISANIAEGFGRYHKRDKIKFYHYARASVYESFDWFEKAKKRNLINEEQYQHIIKNLRLMPKLLNALIKNTFEHLKD